MTALVQDRDTKKKGDKLYDPPAAAAKKFFGGGIVCLNASGYATPGAVATTLKALGRCAKQVDNSAGAAGDLTVPVEKGVFLYANSASTDAITRAEIGTTCYIVDDQTVAKTDGSGARSAAGTVDDVDSATGGVWVRFT